MRKKNDELDKRSQMQKEFVPLVSVPPCMNKKFTFQFITIVKGIKTLKYIDVIAQSEKEAWEFIEREKMKDEEDIYSGFFAISGI